MIMFPLNCYNFLYRTSLTTLSLLGARQKLEMAAAVEVVSSDHTGPAMDHK